VFAGWSPSKTNRTSVHGCCHAGKLAWTSAEASAALPHPDSAGSSSTEAFTA
jgi:hypothetical protein